MIQSLFLDLICRYSVVVGDTIHADIELSLPASFVIPEGGLTADISVTAEVRAYDGSFVKALETAQKTVRLVPGQATVTAAVYVTPEEYAVKYAGFLHNFACL